MKKNDKYRYLAKNTIIFSISSFGSKILVFLLVPLYTNILSTSDYGIADIITTTATLLLFIFSLNISDAVLRFGIDADNKLTILSFGIKVFMIGSAILLVCIIGFSRIKIIKWDYSYYCFLFLVYLTMGLNQILSNYLRAIDKINDVAIAGLITTLITVVCSICFLIFLQRGLNGYLLSIVLGNGAACIYTLIKGNISVSSVLRQTCEQNKNREMLLYSVPLIFNGIAWWMNNSIDKYFVTAICGAAENGIYAVAYKIPTILTIVHTIFSQAWNLSAIREYDKEDSDGFFSNTYELYNTILVISCSLLIFGNNFLAKLLFAKDFYVAWNYSSVLLLSIIFSSLAAFVGSVFSAIKNSKIFAFSTVVSAFINCLLNAILIPVYGSMGAAIATCISFLMIWLIRLICSFKYLHWHVSFGKHIVLYLLLIAQVVIEHLPYNRLVLQIPIIILIIVSCKNEICRVFNKVSSNRRI